MVELVLPMKPRGKKNSRPIFKNRRTGKMFLGKDKAQVDYEEKMRSLVLDQISSGLNSKNTLPFGGPVSAEYVFMFKMKQTCDFDNAITMCNDNCQAVCKHCGQPLKKHSKIFNCPLKSKKKNKTKMFDLKSKYEGIGVFNDDKQIKLVTKVEIKENCGEEKIILRFKPIMRETIEKGNKSKAVSLSMVNGLFNKK